MPENIVQILSESEWFERGMHPDNEGLAFIERPITVTQYQEAYFAQFAEIIGDLNNLVSNNLGRAYAYLQEGDSERARMWIHSAQQVYLYNQGRDRRYPQLGNVFCNVKTKKVDFNKDRVWLDRIIREQKLDTKPEGTVFSAQESHRYYLDSVPPLRVISCKVGEGLVLVNPVFRKLDWADPYYEIFPWEGLPSQPLVVPVPSHIYITYTTVDQNNGHMSILRFKESCNISYGNHDQTEHKVEMPVGFMVKMQQSLNSLDGINPVDCFRSPLFPICTDELRAGYIPYLKSIEELVEPSEFERLIEQAQKAGHTINGTRYVPPLENQEVMHTLYPEVL